jgi:DNA primase
MPQKTSSTATAAARGGDLIRFVQLSRRLSFSETLAHLKQQLGFTEPDLDDALREAVAFYRLQLDRHPEALDYLHRPGVHDATLIEQLAIGYAPGGMLFRHMAEQGYSPALVQQAGRIHQRKDTFYRRIVFPCFEGSRPVNLYGRSLDGAAPHRFLARSKGGLFAWSRLGNPADVVLVEGLFDLAVLWQAGFLNTTCAFGVHLSPNQLEQLAQRPDRTVFITFDSDSAGQNASTVLAQKLRTAAINVRIVDLPPRHDPNSYFLSGASAADFQDCLDQARWL